MIDEKITFILKTLSIVRSSNFVYTKKYSTDNNTAMINSCLIRGDRKSILKKSILYLNKLPLSETPIRVLNLVFVL